MKIINHSVVGEGLLYWREHLARVFCCCEHERDARASGGNDKSFNFPLTPHFANTMLYAVFTQNPCL